MSSVPRRVALGFFATLALCLVGTASAVAAVYAGTSAPHNVPVHLFTNNKDRPTSLHYGRYKVPCTHGYRTRLRAAGAVPPFTRSGPGELFDRYHNEKASGEATIVSKAHHHGNVWSGRFHAKWVYRKDGDAYTRCEIAFDFILKPKP